MAESTPDKESLKQSLLEKKVLKMEKDMDYMNSQLMEQGTTLFRLEASFITLRRENKDLAKKLYDLNDKPKPVVETKRKSLWERIFE